MENIQKLSQPKKQPKKPPKKQPKKKIKNLLVYRGFKLYIPLELIVS